MYKNDYDAAYNRAQALERELAEVKAQKDADAHQVAALQQSLAQAQATIARIRGAGGVQPGMNPHLLPSNGTTVLVLGILSVTICALLGPLAWHYGSDELRRIDMGMANPLKRGEVVAGRVLGIIATVLMGLSMLFVFFVIAAG